MTTRPGPRETALIVIGCSAGGVEALGQLLPVLKAPFSAAIAVAIHLPPRGENLVTQLFERKCSLRVKEAEDKEPIAAGTIYFAPADYHLLVEADGTFALSTEEPVNFSRPSIDLLFQSAALAYRERLAGALLTGANSDGAEGIVTILGQGGEAILQAPDSAQYPTMPAAALALAPTTRVADLEGLKSWLLDRGKGR